MLRKSNQPLDFMLPNENDMELGFLHRNDIDSLGSDCSKLLLRVDSNKGEVDELDTVGNGVKVDQDFMDDVNSNPEEPTETALIFPPT